MLSLQLLILPLPLDGKTPALHCQIASAIFVHFIPEFVGLPSSLV